jgi:hypothetical protein
MLYLKVDMFARCFHLNPVPVLYLVIVTGILSPSAAHIYSYSEEFIDKKIFSSQSP